MDQPGFGSRVGIGRQHVDGNAVDRGDVDDLCWPLPTCGAAEGSEQRLNEEERSLDVQIHDLVPAALGKALDRLTPSRASVVDENVEPGFFRQIEVGQRPGATRPRRIRGYRRTFAESGEALGCFLAGRALP